MVMAIHEDAELTKEIESVTFRGIVNELKEFAKKHSDEYSRLIIIFDQDGVSCERQWL